MAKHILGDEPYALARCIRKERLMYPLIDTYLYHVGKHLPNKQKEDILKELRANIYDQLEATDAPVTDEVLTTLLIKLGSPASVAKEYTQMTNCIIGPELIEIYWNVVRYVLLGLAIAYAVIGALTLATLDYSVANVTRTIVQFLSRTWNTGIGVYGTITLIFTLVYRNMQRENQIGDHEGPKWDAKVLHALKPAVLPNEALKKSESVFSIAWTIVGLLLLNAIAYGTSSSFGVVYHINDLGLSGIESTSLAAINGTLLKGFMPFINVVLGAGLIHDIYLLVHGRWSKRSRAIDIALSLIGLVLFLMLWLNPALIDWTKASSTMGSVDGLATSLNITRNLVALGIVIATGFSVADHIRKIR